jgi:hypothetical protein
MKLSSHASKIKRAAQLIPLLSATACAAVVAQAPFAARNDTVEPGDLAGPFDGRVVDAASGKPIADAIVQASFGFETGRGLTAPAGAVVTTVTSGSDGSYVIDRLSETGSYGGARLQSMTLIIYKRGFVAYRSDRIFDDLRARTDFVQHRNLAKLERMPSGISHVKHVRFVGGAGELKRALGSEVVAASLELYSGAPVGGGANGEEAASLDAGALLSEAELKATTGYVGALSLEALTDLPASASYGSRHFRAVGKTETYDAAVRVWRLPVTAAEARFAQLLKDVPHATKTDEVGDSSLRGYDGRIVAVAALDRAHGLVIELTCGLDQCRDEEQAVSLLRRMIGRAERLGGAPPAAKVPSDDALPPPELK